MKPNLPFLLQRKLFTVILTIGIPVVCGIVSACSDSLQDVFHSPDDEITISPLATELGFSQDHPLVMGMNTSYAPLQYVNNQGAPSGYDVEFTKKLMKRMGIPFTFSPNHWDKMSPGVIEGKYDIGMLVYSSYRKELTNYSNAVFRMYYQIVYRKKDYNDFDFRHLKGKRIAYMKSRPIGLMLKDAEAIDIRITNLDTAFIELAKGKYDGLICYRFQAKYSMEQLALSDELQTQELSLEPREYCYASHDSLLIAAVNKELKLMEEEGIIDEVYGDNVLTQFGTIKVPLWVWALLGLLVFVFLIVFSVNRYRYSKRLQLAHEKLTDAYNHLSETNTQLKIANERAEESTRMKSNFIKQISHEIRTPLNILSGFTQLLTSPGVKLSAQEQEEASTQIIKSTDRITGLVNKMLELSDISSQHVLERNDLVTPKQIVLQAINASGVQEETHIAFSLCEEDGADRQIVTDQHAAVRMVELLLDNAIKFTKPAESLQSSVTTADKKSVKLTVGATDHMTTISVEDTGIGIPAEESEHIFDEFVQLDEYYNGTGIGLTVARSLARRLGGDVVLDTTSTGSTRFVITLPA